MIPYGKHEITNEDIDAVTKALTSDFITQGEYTPQFEKLIADKVGASHSVAVNSATSALHLACRALGVSEKDTVWTSPITFVASANCALYCGAKVDFVDIDPKTYNLSVEALTDRLKVAERSNSLPKVVIVVHLTGQSCEMPEIYNLCKNYGIMVIEDASHAIGAKYRGQYVGSCLFSDVTIFSFHPVKIITTAEGGMAVTNNCSLANKMRQLRSHGITRNSDEMVGRSEGSWYYQQIDLGYNYRITDIQAALGISQLKRLDHYVKKRNELAVYYDKILSDLPLILPFQNEFSYSARHLYVVKLPPNLKRIRDALFEQLLLDDIGVNVHYIPVHLHPYYKNLGFRKGDFPVAEDYYETAISIPLYSELTNAQQEYIAERLQNNIRSLI